MGRGGTETTTQGFGFGSRGGRGARGGGEKSIRLKLVVALLVVLMGGGGGGDVENKVKEYEGGGHGYNERGYIRRGHDGGKQRQADEVIRSRRAAEVMSVMMSASACGLTKSLAFR